MRQYGDHRGEVSRQTDTHTHMGSLSCILVNCFSVLNESQRGSKQPVDHLCVADCVRVGPSVGMAMSVFVHTTTVR